MSVRSFQPPASLTAMEAPRRTGSLLEVRSARPGDDDARDDLVRALPHGTFFHLSGWRRVVQRVFAHRAEDLVAVEDGEIVGVLPMMSCRAPNGRRALISMPYAVYGGPLGRSPEIESFLLASAVQLAERERATRLELRSRTPLAVDSGPRFHAHDLYATFVADLPDKVEDVLARMPKKSRAEARKARDKHGLRLTEGIWYLDDLHRLFHRNKRALGSPGLPLALFRALQDEFGPAVTVHAVHRGDQPLATVMSFLWRDECMAYYAGTADDADREWSASNFMYMALQEWSVERGFKRFDFGRSRKDSGAFQFKRHQGFEPVDLPYALYLVGNAKPPSFNPSNPKTRWLRETWSRLPPWLTHKLSDQLARYLP